MLLENMAPSQAQMSHFVQRLLPEILFPSSCLFLCPFCSHLSGEGLRQKESMQGMESGMYIEEMRQEGLSPYRAEKVNE